jgi:glycine/D-amino acid oxidase-like deaminating enzyme
MVSVSGGGIARASRPAAGSLWQRAAPRMAPHGTLAGDHDADVLVIGGGLAGVSTALHLAEAGIDVALLEAGQIGGGATDVSGGLIAPDFIRNTPDTITAQFGDAAGARLVGLIADSAQLCFDLAARHAIECDASQDGFWSPAHTTDLAAIQQRTAGQWQAAGHDVDFVDEAETQARLGSGRYVGALRFGRGGSLNPLAFVQGLAGAAARAGARVFADSPVAGLSRTAKGWRAQTSGGSLCARRVVLAANGGNPALHKALRRTILPLRVVEFATEPLPAADRRRILPCGGAFTDKQPYVFTARYDGAGRLISAFGGSYRVRGEVARHAEARRCLAAAFPEMQPPSIAHLWEGTAWLNTSLLPRIHDVGDGVLAIQACNGRGLSTNVAIGREVAEALATRRFDLLSVKPAPPVPIRLHFAARILPILLMSLAR